MSLADLASHRQGWDGHERRNGRDSSYSGPERRLPPRVRILEASNRVLIDQSAEYAVILQGLDHRMKQAVADGFREVLRDEVLMDSLLEKLLKRIQKGAAEQTGLWLWGSLKTVFTKWLVIAAIVLMVGQMAGLAPAKIMFGWLTKD